MGNINDASLQDLNKQLNAKWTEAFSGMPQSQLRSIATQYTSTTATNFYAFLEAMPSWVEWHGARQFRDIVSQQWEVKNKDYEMSVKMDKNQLEDDQIGLYIDIIPEMVAGWFKLQESLIMDVLTSNSLAYDGAALFGTTRTYGDNTISNYTTSALTASTFETARVTMQSYKDAGDTPLGVKPNTLIVGPGLEKTSFDIVRNYFGYDATDKVQIENFYETTGTRIVVSPHLTGTYANYWYLADTAATIKGVFLQIRETPSPLLSNAQEVARTKTVDYMADGRLTAAAGIPSRIYGGIVSA